MKKIKKFFKDVTSRGIKYAFAVRLMYTFEDSKIEALRMFSSRCWDYAYLTDTADYYAEYYEERSRKAEEEIEVTQCGCTMFACWECGSYPVCGQ